MPSSPPWIDPELEKEWRKVGHPCPQYSEAFKRMTEEQKQREYEEFNRFMDSLRTYRPYPGGLPTPIVINPPETAPYRPQPRPTRRDSDEDFMQYPKGLWYKHKRGLYDFLKDTLFVMVILIVLNTILVGEFSLILIIIRSVVIVIVFYIVDYLYKKTRYVIPWKWVAIAALVIIGAGIYSTRNYSMLRIIDSIVGIQNFTGRSIVPIFDYLQNLNKTATLNAISNVSSSILPQPIDSKWVDGFISEVNAERAKNGLRPLQKAPQLDAIAYSRFNTMMMHPDISHYGAGAYPGGEVVFYPAGFTPQNYATDVKNTAPLHWEILVSPMVSYYGYYVGSGPVVQAIGSCSATEIPGPNINVTQYLQQQGCQPTMSTATWLVIDMS